MTQAKRRPVMAYTLRLVRQAAASGDGGVRRRRAPGGARMGRRAAAELRC
jgi:hypothetical protein